MDLSKLPKLSQTDAPPPPETPPPQPVIPVSPGVGPDVWFNTIVGLLVIYLGRFFGKYLWSRLTGQEFHTGFLADDGVTELKYFQLAGYTAMSDGGIFFFGIVILLEAAVKAWLGIKGRVPRAIAGFAVALAVATTAFNLFVLGKVMANGFGPNILSALAVAYGGYIIFDLLTIYRFRTA